MESIGITEFAENHPQVVMGSIITIVIMIILYFLNSYRWFGETFTSSKKSKKTDPLNDLEEFDQLIDSIHGKQRTGQTSAQK
jgi:putative exporter of polyketide antibiotics